MKIGIVGLPNVGKSTLFSALTNYKAEIQNYPFCTIDPNIGIVEVPDKRIDKINEIINTRKIVPAVIEFVDIAGLVKGASKGEGLGNKFLSNIREVDAIVHVVRCFEDSNITHVENGIDPVRDAILVETELALADLEVLEKAKAKIEKKAKVKDKDSLRVCEALNKAEKIIQEEADVSILDDNDRKELKSFNFLMLKPLMYAANLSEEAISNPESEKLFCKLKEYCEGKQRKILPVCPKMELELSELTDSEKAEFLADIGAKESGLNLLIRESYDTLGLETFFTAGEKEIRAWTISKKSSAVDAAGTIHSDMAKGFIAAEVINFEKFIEVGGYQKAKEKGLISLEGKNYIVRDGDIIVIRFNV